MSSGFEPVTVSYENGLGDPVTQTFDPTDINGIGQSDSFVESLQWLYASTVPWPEVPVGSVFRNVVQIGAHHVWQGTKEIPERVGDVLANPQAFPVERGYRAYTPAQLKQAARFAHKYNLSDGGLNSQYLALINAAADSGVDPRTVAQNDDPDPR